MTIFRIILFLLAWMPVGNGYEIAVARGYSSGSTSGHAGFTIRGNARGEMLRQRGEKIIRINDEVIARTLRAYGGDYKRDGKKKLILLNGRIYKDFKIDLIRGRYLIITTSDGRYLLEVVNN
jgi:hypothetical protein